MIRVMHSMHASFAELRAFVAYLQPESIVPCVIPSSLGDSSLSDLHVRWGARCKKTCLSRHDFLPVAASIILHVLACRLRHLVQRKETTRAQPTDKTRHSIQRSLVSEDGPSRCGRHKIVSEESSQSDDPGTDDEYVSSDDDQPTVDGVFSLSFLSVTESARKLPSMIPHQHQLYDSPSCSVSSCLRSAKPKQPAIDLSFSESSSVSTVRDSQTSTDSAETMPITNPTPKKQSMLATVPIHDNQTVPGTDLTLLSGGSQSKQKEVQRKRRNNDELKKTSADLLDSDEYLEEKAHISCPLPKRAKIEESEICVVPSWEVIDLTLLSDSDSLTEEDETSVVQIESTPMDGVKSEGTCLVKGHNLPLESRSTLHEDSPSNLEKRLHPAQVKVDMDGSTASKCVSNKATRTLHRLQSREVASIARAGLPTFRPHSREGTPVGRAGSPPFSPQSLGSPCFLPLTPDKNRETTESILSKNVSFL